MRISPSLPVSVILLFNFQGLSVNQIKKIRQLTDEAITKTDHELHECEKERNKTIFEIGNLLHETCVISNNEVKSFFFPLLQDILLTVNLFSFENAAHRIRLGD